MNISEEKEMLTKSIGECIEVQHKIASIVGFGYGEARTAINIIVREREQMEKRLRAIKKSEAIEE